MRLWLTTSPDDFTSEFDDIEEMFKRGLSRLILWKRGRAGSPNASEGDYERWLMALPMEYRDRIWIRGTPDMAERLEVRGCVIDASVLGSDTVGLLRTVEMTNLGNNAKMTYTIVNPHEANLKEGKISIKSPIAEALLGRKIGETVEAHVPSGILKLRIDNITL